MRKKHEIFATSMERYAFLIDAAKKALQEDPNNESLKNAIKFYEKCRDENCVKKESRNDLENDLRGCSWIINKCKKSKVYSQNLYAALCNNDFKKIGLLESFADIIWHTSWRGSGGIVANLREQGDYIDFYCSGMSDKEHFLSEGEVSKEIEQDLKKLGWQIVIHE